MTEEAGGNRDLSSLLLHYHLIQNPLSPMYNNIASALLTIIYVKLVMEIGAFIRVRYGVPELSRKFVHLCACSWVVFWPLFDSSHWGWRLNVTVPVVMSLRLLYKGAILKDPEDEDVLLLSRTSSPSELLYGPLQMTLIMCYVGLTKFMTNTGVLIMASLVGDWMAAMVGIQYGKHKYKVPLGGNKSIEGTIGCVIGTMGGMWFYSFMCGIEVVTGWRMLLAYGCVSALVEATALCNWDNLLLALAMQLSAKHLPNIIR
mmetsp:Transcript_28407/g.52423  ORF Transcript_28407/g.52423 Transcript_28407/m.52423 type:complete len:259 (+) Transcript_28407:107-883(+)|eukprot:CAMPEP_0201868408 /NCGR_PEP_ID=MMETSP0902-20130614/2305_1 /ASSEMBLY_ACC=CAM_ASM_000551 /TAXON_ID=420261 /ORGANISM="Thalassiosira antarctica, Strain CCMP982" /LENGTH=258 /DNA_ID=CAMNT_0048393749 /DNA_START=19 /DNA_END=795 /DNA_ORIENTATION=+